MTNPHQTSDFDFELPQHLIADRPATARSQSRLLHAANGVCTDTHFHLLPALLKKGDLLVVNDSKVIRARLHARKPGGGRVEIMLERITGKRRALARLKANKPPGAGLQLQIAGDCRVTVTGRQGEFFILQLAAGDFASLLERHGRVPLPPYIKRRDDDDDETRYQTVYAKYPGSVAAPTAGLHFDHALLHSLAGAGVELGSLTLHVGSGTYQPIRAGTLEQHRMHAETFTIDQHLCDAIARCRSRNGRIVAVGTTTVRALETLAAGGAIRPAAKSTSLFIKPGFKFQLTDIMITNFHLPRTSLFVLVCAFAGREQMLAAYRHAIAQSYRFFSYGDAMLIERAP